MKHLEHYCKYDRTVSFPAVIDGVCEECREALCSTCGYKWQLSKYCNECWSVEKNKPKSEAEYEDHQNAK